MLTINPGQGVTSYDGARHPLFQRLAVSILRTRYSLLEAFSAVIVVGAFVEGPAVKVFKQKLAATLLPSDPGERG